MNEAPQPFSTLDSNKPLETERTKQVTVAGWTAGLSAFFALGALASSPTWPVAMGVAAVSAMVAVVCFSILNRK